MLKKKKIPNKKREHACIMWDQIRSLYIMHQRIKGKDNWFPHTYLIQYIPSCTKPKPLIPNQTVTKPDLILKIKHLHTHEWNSYRSSASLSPKKKKKNPTQHTLSFLPSILWILDQPLSYLSSAVYFVKKSLPFFSSLPSLFFFPEILLLLSQEEPLRQPRSAFSLSGLDLHSFFFFFF